MRRRADGLGGLRGTIRKPSERIPTMGLDMYLTKRSAAARDEQDEMVAYWRKANHIHGWFERNVAYGELENCELYPVSFEQLMSLGITCQLVKANPESAPVLLPRQEGFFFGSGEYDDDYFMDVDDTLEIIRKVCDALQDNDELFYHAWW